MTDIPFWAWVEIGLVLFISGQYFYIQRQEKKIEKLMKDNQSIAGKLLVTNQKNKKPKKKSWVANVFG